MAHRNEDQDNQAPRQRDGSSTPSRSAARGGEGSLYDGLPSVTNRNWDADRTDGAQTYGYPGQGGYGRDAAPTGGRDHQGGYGESQGAHAQSGQGRGGTQFDGRDHAGTLSRTSSGHRGRGPQGYVRPDDSIVDDIIGRLTEDAHIDASEILVMVEAGVVTLTGNVPERAMKHRAEDIVADASGVRDVENRIRVDNGSASAGRPGEAIRSGGDQLGSGFSSSERPDPLYDNPTEDSNWPGR